MTITDYLTAQSDRVNRALEALLPDVETQPEMLHRAMRYSVFAGGKRLRPAMCLAAGEMFDAPEAEILPVAAALEMIHTYSLIHDDLPAMDDDDLRRGRPTCHKVFGEALAILAGDALLTFAFRVLAEFGVSDANRARRLQILAAIARAAGSPQGMVAGQVVDLASEGQSLAVDELDLMHGSKTGALLTVAVVSGALCGSATDAEIASLARYGAAVGLAFQIADDILDQTASREDLGKTPGKDQAAAKATYPALFGIDGSRARARHLVETALEELAEITRPSDRLADLARFAIDRAK